MDLDDYGDYNSSNDIIYIMYNNSIKSFIQEHIRLKANIRTSRLEDHNEIDIHRHIDDTTMLSFSHSTTYNSCMNDNHTLHDIDTHELHTNIQDLGILDDIKHSSIHIHSHDSHIPIDSSNYLLHTSYRDIIQSNEHISNTQFMHINDHLYIHPSMTNFINHSLFDHTVTNDIVSKFISSLCTDSKSILDAKSTYIHMSDSDKFYIKESLESNIQSIKQDHIHTIEDSIKETLSRVYDICSSMNMHINKEELVNYIELPSITKLDDLINLIPYIKYDSKSTKIDDSYYIKSPMNVLITKLSVCLDIGLMFQYYLNLLGYDSRLIYTTQTNDDRCISEHSYILFKYLGKVIKIDPYHHRHMIYGEKNILYPTSYNIDYKYHTIMTYDVIQNVKKIRSKFIRSKVNVSTMFYAYDISSIVNELYNCEAHQYRSHIRNTIKPFYKCSI